VPSITSANFAGILCRFALSARRLATVFVDECPCEAVPRPIHRGGEIRDGSPATVRRRIAPACVSAANGCVGLVGHFPPPSGIERLLCLMEG
jgi:hypothetical protein